MAEIKSVELGWQTAEGSGIEMFVRDNGIGIEERQQQQIFDIFRRLHTEREFGGTGIGLAIVKRAVQKLGGRLRVEAQPGRGNFQNPFFHRIRPALGRDFGAAGYGNTPGP